MAHADKAMALILEDLGAEAYGVFWLLIEDISAPMEKGKYDPSAVHSVTKWAQICHCSARGFRKIVDRLAGERLIVCETTADRLQITIPNILKYKDEYAKKSGDSQESKAETQPHQKTEGKAQTDPEKKSGGLVAFPPQPIRVSPEEEQRNLRAAAFQQDWDDFVVPFPEQTDVILGQQYFGTLLYAAANYETELQSLKDARDLWLGCARWHNGYRKSVGGWFASKQYADRPKQCPCGTKDPLHCPLQNKTQKPGGDQKKNEVLGKPSDRALSSSSSVQLIANGGLAYVCG